MNTDKVYESKLKEVQAALKALYEFVDDYIHDDKNLEIPALELIKVAIDFYENPMGEEE